MRARQSWTWLFGCALVLWGNAANAATTRVARSEKAAKERSGFGRNVPLNQPEARWARDRPIVPGAARDKRLMAGRPKWLPAKLAKIGPILTPRQDIAWMSRSVINPGPPIVKDGEINLFVRAEDHTGAGKWFGTSRIVRFTSKDGVHFEPREVALEPTEWFETLGGTEDPHGPVRIGRKYYMTYTGYNWNDKTARLSLAESDDLVHWRKMGPMFEDGSIPYRHGENPNWSKSGAIVPWKVNGEYVMYFGDENIYLARSKDLRKWTVDPEPVMTPGPGYGLVEPGSVVPSRYTRAFDGSSGSKHPDIHLVFNSDGRAEGGYALHEAVFSGRDPRQLLSRTSTPILKVDQPYEIEGQVGRVVFGQAPVRFKNKYYFYYGAGDAIIAAAVADAPKIVRKQSNAAAAK
jgi:beta-1,2-mannosidase